MDEGLANFKQEINQLTAKNKLSIFREISARTDKLETWSATANEVILQTNATNDKSRTK